MARAEAALTDPERSPSPYRGVFCSMIFFMNSPAPRPAVLRGLFSPWGRFGLRGENGALMWLSVRSRFASANAERILDSRVNPVLIYVCEYIALRRREG